MAFEDYMEPEVGIAVAVTAAVASPQVRNVLRRGAVYGLAGVLMAGDAVSSLARGVKRGVEQRAAPEPETIVASDQSIATTEAETPIVAAKYASVPDEPIGTGMETAETTHKRTRKSAEAKTDE